MHKQWSFFFLALLIRIVVFGQEQDPPQLQETARQFMRSGDWNNAVLVLNKALSIEPGNPSLQKDLALTYYYQRDYLKAKEVIGGLLEKEDADVQVFQIAGNIHKALQEVKECEKLYRKGLKKYPGSGPLYAEFGDLLWMNKDNSCIQQWETGIKADPSFAANYYHAARYYSYTKELLWTLLYGEMFLNMESYSGRTAEIKTLLLETYKRIFLIQPEPSKPVKGPEDFATAVWKRIQKQNQTVSSGINTESLILLRTRFLLDWFYEMKDRFPFRLFDHQRQLLQEGMFEAYNYWIFEAPSNLSAFENWTKIHATEYADFTRYQKSKIFKVPEGQYYRTK